jgi:hypothetical protein
MIESVEALQGVDFALKFLKVISPQSLECETVVGLDLSFVSATTLRSIGGKLYRVQKIVRALEKAVTSRMNRDLRDDPATSFLLVLLIHEWQDDIRIIFSVFRCMLIHLKLKILGTKGMLILHESFSLTYCPI